MKTNQINFFNDKNFNSEKKQDKRHHLRLAQQAHFDAAEGIAIIEENIQWVEKALKKVLMMQHTALPCQLSLLEEQAEKYQLFIQLNSVKLLSLNKRLNNLQNDISMLQKEIDYKPI